MKTTMLMVTCFFVTQAVCFVLGIHAAQATDIRLANGQLLRNVTVGRMDDEGVILTPEGFAATATKYPWSYILPADSARLRVLRDGPQLTRVQLTEKIHQIDVSLASWQQVFKTVFIPAGTKQRQDIQDKITRLQSEKERLVDQRLHAPTEIASSNGKSTESVQSSDAARQAADAYITSLMQNGIVFSSEFKSMIVYSVKPPTVEVIYVLDYLGKNSGRRVSSYTITCKKVEGNWTVIGGTPGDRAATLNTEPVIGTNGVWTRSPLEQQIGEAISKGH